MLINQHDPEANEMRRKLWAGRSLIFGMITASTATILFCPCDNPGRSSLSVLLIAMSTVLGCVAALFIYRELRVRSDITSFLKSVIALAIVSAGVYAEFNLATDIIAWLAQPH
jgi:hypothetical protein